MATGGPRKIGPYEIVDELGRGGMGVVYRAFDPAIGRALAIKVLHMPHLGPEEMVDMRQRFAREAAAAGRLSHPGIVTLYQFGEDGDSQYLAMELISGGPLDRLMREGQPWPLGDALRIVRQIAEALDYAHANGVVHRDIKPANILVQPDGRVKVTDFGIARIATHTVTKTGFAVGTPAYMAPEQIQGQRVDARADQFSLAVAAFLLLTGKPPFGADSEYGLLYQIVNGEAASAAGLNPSLPKGADAVFRRALAKTPEARFASCGEFVAALESAILGPALAETAELTRRTMPVVPPRRKKPWPLLAILTLIVAAGAGWAWLSSRRAAPAPPPAAPVTSTASRDGLTYVNIPAGSFTMGCSPGDPDCDSNESPVHPVTIGKPFRISTTPVTQAAWQTIMGNNPSHFQGADLPVESVTWEDAGNYCRALNMRLPTEAEWEYAARAGNPARRYGDLESIAWFLGNSGNTTHPVGQKQPNAWGLYDMLGNVWEWVSDRYTDRYGAAPRGPVFRVMRGGSWDNEARMVRASSRGGNPPGNPVYYTGFRCVE